MTQVKQPILLFPLVLRMRILVVCLGNICRSPIAEGVLRHKARERGLNWTVDSAGTNSYHIGEPPHVSSQKVCKANGIDISGQRARRFVKEDFKRYDLIYAMAKDVMEDILTIGGNATDPTRLRLFLNELEDGCNRSVPDPWYGDEEGYLPVFEMIEATAEAILEKYDNR